MKVHMGIDPMEGKMGVFYMYNNLLYEVNFGIKKANYSQLGTIKLMYESITKCMQKFVSEKLTLGCACIYLPKMYKSAESTLLEMGMQYGFEEIVAVDSDQLLCVEAISQQNNISRECGMIRVYAGNKIFVLFENQVVEALSQSTDDAVLLEKYPPNIIIFEKNYGPKEYIMKKYSGCTFLNFESKSPLILALTYAKVMGKALRLYSDDRIAPMYSTLAVKKTRKKVDKIATMEAHHPYSYDCLKVHVGIDPINGKTAVFYKYESRFRVVTYDIKKGDISHLATIKAMFESIKKCIQENCTLGCVCIYMPEKYNNAQIFLSEMEIQYGFEKVVAVDSDTLLCVEAISQQNNISKNSGVIRIYAGDKIFVWIKNRSVETFTDNSIDVSDAPRLKKYPPNIIIFETSYGNKQFVMENYPGCTYLNFESKSPLRLALTYAKVIGKEISLYSEESFSTAKNVPTAEKTTNNIDNNKADDKIATKKDDTLHSNDVLTNQKSENFYSFPTKPMTDSSDVSIVGIDLGTSRCCVAVNRKSGITTIPLDNTGERLLPSYVAFDEKHAKCGQIVVERLRHHAKSTVFDSKRIIGRSINELEINSIWPFKLIDQNEKLYLEITNFNGSFEITAEQVSAELLKFMKNKAEAFQGTNLTSAVITVPAAFTGAQKSATKEAAKLAGWKNITFLPEPIASSFAYFIDRPIPNNSTVLLFDLGGGTLDSSPFKIQNSQIIIISNIGDTKLGGRDFDTVLINHFKNILGTKFGISMIKDKRYKLMVKCQKLKETLSVMASCGLDVDEFDTTQDGIITITRKEFESITKPLLNKIQNTVNAALYDSKFASNQINKVLHVGGGSRMPMIKQLLNDLFPLAEHCVEEHPDEVVAIGAAYYAYCNTLDLSK